MGQKFHKLRVRFAELDLSQRDVAKAAGITESTFSSRMTGKQLWTSLEILNVADVLGIPLDQIGTFFFEDRPQSRKGA